MKKMFALLLAAAMLFALSACGSTPSTEVPETEKTVYNVSIAHGQTEENSIHAGALKYKELLEATGYFNVTVYPNGQLGADREMIESCQNGEITIVPSGSAPQVNFVPEVAIFDLMFVYPDVETARKTINDQEFFNKMAESYEKAGFHLLGWTDQGFRQLTLNKPVQTPEDLKGMTIRTQENNYHMEAWRALGANPTPLAYNELYTALQQGTVDGQENPIENITTAKLYEQQKYIILTNHNLQTVPWIMNAEFYNSLPEEVQKIVDEVSVEVMEYALNAADASIDTCKATITGYGCEIIEVPEENKELFSGKMDTNWSMVKEAVGGDIYDAFFAALNAAKA